MTGGALLLQAGLGLLLFAGADVVPLLVFVVPAGLRARDAAQLTGTAAHQRSEEVGVRLVVTPCEGLVLGELLACEVELLLANNCRHFCHRDPLLRRKRDGRVVRVSYGVGGGAPDLRGPVARAAGVDSSGVDGVGQYSAQCGHAPHLPAPGRGDAPNLQMPRNPKEARSFFKVHREDLSDHRGLRLIWPHSRRVAGPVGVDAVAVGDVCPRQEQPGFVLGKPTSAHPLREQRPLVLSHRSADLQEELVVLGS